MNLVRLASYFCAFVVAANAWGAEPANEVQTKTGLAFVQDFYTWYVPMATADAGGPALEVALKEKSDCFDAKLLQALRDDAAAQEKADGEIVGLDFDPFLNSQDPSDHYVAGAIVPAGNLFKVDIYSETSGKRSDEPDVIADLELNKGKWQFVNFHYPKTNDLLTILSSLRADRIKAK